MCGVTVNSCEKTLDSENHGDCRATEERVDETDLALAQG